MLRRVLITNHHAISGSLSAPSTSGEGGGERAEKAAESRKPAWNMTINTPLFLCLSLLFANLLFAQQAELIVMPQPTEKLLAEDARTGFARFAAPLAVDIAPATAPENYPQIDGQFTWSYTFKVPGAAGLSLLLEDVFLRGRGSIEVTTARGQSKVFTAADVTTRHRLFTRFLPGEAITLTYRGDLPDQTPFRIVRLDHVYRPRLVFKGFGDSNDCHVNANCPAGDGWDDVKSGNCRIQVVVEEGSGFCSGNLINNTARDGRPLLLTGFHCRDGFTPLYDVWAFDFDYRSATCEKPTTEPSPITFAGCTELAGRQESDYLLLELTDPNFVAEDHYFAGWDRSDGGYTQRARHFHHPQGDIQKLSWADGGLRVFGGNVDFGNGLVLPPRHLFVADYDLGTFEPGSSGSAFFDDDKRIRGHLTGGNPSCPGETEAFVGRLFQDWTYGLSDFLDPLQTGVTQLDGENLLTNLIVTGQAPTSGIKVTFRWTQTDSTTVTTDANGRYRLRRPNDVAAFTVRAEHPPTPPDERVDIFDLVATRRHILGLDTLPPVQLLAADVNGSGDIRTSDIIQMTRVILATDGWRERPNWLVLPANFPLVPTPTAPSIPIGIALNNPAEREITIDLIRIKTGDANGS